MTESFEPSHKQGLGEVLPYLELEGFQTYELRARRRDEVHEDELPDGLDTDGEGLAFLRMHANQNDDQLMLRVAATSASDLLVINVDMAVRFVKAQAIHLDQDVLGVFIEKVAIMALFPYLRQAVHDLSSRLGAPMTLHLLRAGGVSVERDDADESEGVKDADHSGLF